MTRIIPTAQQVTASFEIKTKKLRSIWFLEKNSFSGRRQTIQNIFIILKRYPKKEKKGQKRQIFSGPVNSCKGLKS